MWVGGWVGGWVRVAKKAVESCGWDCFYLEVEARKSHAVLDDNTLLCVRERMGGWVGYVGKEGRWMDGWMDTLCIGGWVD